MGEVSFPLPDRRAARRLELPPGGLHIGLEIAGLDILE